MVVTNTDFGGFIKKQWLVKRLKLHSSSISILKSDELMKPV